MRVFITGEADEDRTVLVSERSLADLAPVTPAFGTTFAEVLGSDRPLVLPSTVATEDGPRALFPPPGGFRFWIYTVPAHGAPLAPGPETDGHLARMRTVDAARADRLAGFEDGMARADAIEWIVVISGSIEYLIPDGQQLVLGPGDSVVQIAARHRWHNRGDVPCVMAVTAIGCERRESP